MTPKERLLATLKGNTPDRVPVYTLIPYELDNGKMVPGPFHGYADYDDWRSKDPLYRELVDRMSDECDNFYIWRPECMDSCNLAVSPSMVELDSKTEENGKAIFRYRFDLDGRSLYRKEAFQAGTGHKWVTEHFCKSIDDAAALFEAGYENAICETKSLFTNLDELGDRGLPWVTIPSPVMTVCRVFDPQDFLLFSALYKNEIMKFMEIVYERTRQALVRLLDMGAGPIIRFGGAEHATPPMMSPDDFDRLVYDYDKPLMDICHEMGCLVAVHCHGNIKHAVKRFMDMGVDQIDPVEALPWGDISLDEVRKITNEQITLTGNIQFSEITDSSPDAIKKRVRDIIKTAGPERLIISMTGTPPERITRRQFDNYNSMIDTVIEYG